MFDKLGYEESKTKTNKRIEILQNSMDAFIRDGIHSVTMQQVAKECDISIRSLYYYYKSKEELAVDIQICTLTDSFGFIVEEIDSSKTAFEHLQIAINNFVDYIANNHKIIKYIAAFDFYFYNMYPGEKYLNHLQEVQNNESLLALIQLSYKDNSINLHGETIDTVINTLFHSIMAYSQRNIYREKVMSLEKGTNKGSLELHAQLLLESIKKR